MNFFSFALVRATVMIKLLIAIFIIIYNFLYYTVANINAAMHSIMNLLIYLNFKSPHFNGLQRLKFYNNKLFVYIGESKF
jgi:hypothetical protein